MTEEGMTYKDAGVNLELGDEASEVMYNAALATWKNRKGKLGEIVLPFDDFRGVRCIDISGFPEGTVLGANCDGTGTKIEIGERLNDYTTLAHDLLAMAVDDTVKCGGVPIIYTNVMDVNSLGSDEESRIEEVRQYAQGLIAAAEEAGVAVINGEMAELGNRVGGYGPFNTNWSGTVNWIARKDRLFTGHEIKPGMKIIALREQGFRSNGLSLVRRIAETKLGPEWHKENPQLAKDVLFPSRIYCKAVAYMFGGFDQEPNASIAAFVHVTGGGIPGKLGSALKASGTGAHLDELFEPCQAMLQLQAMGEVSDTELYRAWNAGQGGLVITDDPDAVLDATREFEIAARIVGETTNKPGISIKSKGNVEYGKLLEF